MRSSGHAEGQAWHEAGHAVVARLLGGRIRSVSLESELEGLEGHAVIEWRPRDERELAAHSGRTALGGPLAELVFLGGGPLEEPEVLETWEADWAEVERAAARLEPDLLARSRLVAAWVAEVRAMITEPHVEERIARVADALDAHGTLDEDLFEDCLG